MLFCPLLTPIDEDPYFDPNYYGGVVSGDDPFNYSDIGIRYYAWKDCVGDIKWVVKGGTGMPMGFDESDLY